MTQQDLFPRSTEAGAPLIDRYGRPMLQKLFLGLKPPEDVAQDIERRGRGWRQALQLQGVPMPALRLHITLQVVGVYPGALPPGVIDAVEAAMRRLDYPDFDIGFDHVQSFRGNHALVLHGGDERALRELGMQIGLILQRHGLHPEHSRTPHMTLVYDGSYDVADREIEPVHWMASEVVLVRSPQGLGRHEQLGSWPLRH